MRMNFSIESSPRGEPGFGTRRRAQSQALAFPEQLQAQKRLHDTDSLQTNPSRQVASEHSTIPAGRAQVMERELRDTARRQQSQSRSRADGQSRIARVICMPSNPLCVPV